MKPTKALITAMLAGAATFVVQRTYFPPPAFAASFVVPQEKIHPIGASGARIVTTLIAALQDRGLKRGVASLCIGGGEATAMAVELV